MAPNFEFPAPVLSVAADAVRELEGSEALSGLWTLFTKCKASLQDGHRLENISWRLWYREMASPRPGHISESEGMQEDNNRLFDEKTAFLGEEGLKTIEVQQVPSTHVPLPSLSIPKTSLRTHPQLPTTATTGPHLIRRNSFVGKIIVDMLPNPLPPTQHPHSRTETSLDSSQPPSSYFSATHVNSIPDTHSLPIRCHLPTPAASEQRLMPPSAIEVQSALEPAIQVHVDLAPPSTPPAVVPQFVIVHPTPGPTPHPTPPATPRLGGPSTGLSRTIEETHPPPPPKFTLHPEGSTTSSSGSSSTSGRTAVSSASSSSATTDLVIAEPKSVFTTISLANGTAPPPPSSTISHVQPKTGPAPMVRKAHSSPGAHLSPDAGPSRSRPRAQGHIRQTSSASSAGGGKERSKSKSRSRSRGPAEGPSRTGLTMTTTATKRSTGGGGQRGRALGMRRAGSKAGTTSTAHTVARDKRATFNIGSHSDPGSKSAGSGSSVSGPTNGATEGKKPEKQNALAPPPRQQSATRLMPPPLRPLPDPATVLPPKQQQPRRTIVLATSDSDDYETETETDITESNSERGVTRDAAEEEEGDTADWSSEDLSADEVVVRRGAAAQPTSKHDGKGHLRPQHRNHSNTITANNYHQHTTTTNNRSRPAHPHPHPHPHPPPTQQHQPPLSRAQQSRRNQAVNAQYVVEQAALEAARLREMFAKKPVPSSEDLAAQRTRSVGLLTQLMNPDPEIFPPSHPYRRGHSSDNVKGSRVFGGVFGGGGLTMTRANGNSANGAGDRPAGIVQGSTARPEQQRRASAGPAPGLRLSKSSAAIPVASQVQVGSVTRETSQESAKQKGKGGLATGSGTSGAYRPKGRPADQEMDTESEGEGGDANGILVSKSVAQEKLKALAQHRGIVPHERQDREEEEPVPQWLRGPESVNGEARLSASPADFRHSSNGSFASVERHKQPHDTPTPAPAPIPFGHPYNLPPPAPPSTPRTTRRLMLQTEMSESLRRNLLWERQVSKVNLVGFRRSSSGGGSGRSGETVLGGGPLKPLTALPSMVQLTAKQPGSGGSRASSPRQRDRDRERRGSGGEMEGDHDTEDNKKKALARNRSWANEFHYTGW